MNSDIKANIRFFTTPEGGRLTDVGRVPSSDNASELAGPGYYACPLMIDGMYFDCRIPLQGKTLVLGETYELQIKFLDRQTVLPR